MRSENHDSKSKRAKIVENTANLSSFCQAETRNFLIQNKNQRNFTHYTLVMNSSHYLRKSNFGGKKHKFGSKMQNFIFNSRNFTAIAEI